MPMRNVLFGQFKTVTIVIDGKVTPQPDGSALVTEGTRICSGTECSNGIALPSAHLTLGDIPYEDLMKRLVAAYRAGEPVAPLLDEYDTYAKSRTP